ncbi:tRNA pseudouridine(38-40) synthase TruA [Boudabousia tangfeifanii]|nr:tRNA pseudouridine(38-40) synthase TruA [Boudabousia tangfeifanii]
METTRKVRLDLAYDGTDFHGWAAQPGLRTVQGEIEKALALILQRPIALTVAGRTDAGVHASGQVACFDLTEDEWARLKPRHGVDDPGVALTRRLNGLLQRTSQGSGSDVVIYQTQLVPASFDARFSALGRHYSYRLADQLTCQHPTQRHNTTWLTKNAVPLDLAKMNEAATHCLGEHDFLSFCKPREGASTIRTLYQFEFTRLADGVVVADLHADAFCHSQVRSLVGAAVFVGSGKRPVGYLAELIAKPSRDNAAPLAPPEGLTLTKVDYPEGETALAEQAKAARRLRTCEECD